MFFSKYLDNYCRYQYCANDTLFRNISCILLSIFQDILPKKDVAFCETTDTAHSYIKQIVNFSEINHVGLFETYRYKRTGKFFIWKYIGNWYVFSKYLDNYCRYQYCANDTLFRNISSILQSIFQDILPKKGVAFCETTDTAPSLYKTDSKFFGNQCVYRCLKWSH